VEDFVGDDRAETLAGKGWRILSRRRVLQSAGGVIAAAAFSGNGATIAAPPLIQDSPKRASKSDADITGRLARYMVEARSKNLPPVVALEAKHRTLDTMRT